MLRSIKELYGNKLGASDGEIGHLKDFYFDDQDWAVRYVIADTGNWLKGRQVLLSPHAFGSLHLAGKSLQVSLTRKQIENSPAIETHKPVSRQYEEEYHRYYGWPYYWEGDGLWGGMRDFPIMDLPPTFSPAKSDPACIPKPVNPDAHLRSTQAVKGYHLQATDGITGYVSDFRLDDQSWAITELVVKTGHRFSGKEVQIPVGFVTRISYEESTVFLSLTKDDVEKSTENLPAPNSPPTKVVPIPAL